MTTLYTPGSSYLAAVAELADNPEQLQVYRSTTNIAVLAGPGSGKTKTLTVTLARLLAEAVRMPHGIACISYNTECVREIRRRLLTLGVTIEPPIFLGTMHSFCLNEILRPFAKPAGIPTRLPITPITDAEDKQLLERALAESFGGSHPPRPKELLRAYRQARVLGEPLTAFPKEVRALAKSYENGLLALSRVDPDGMIEWALRIFVKHAWIRAAIVAKYPIVAIDEYQDFGPELHALALQLLGTGDVRVIAVGDPDQSIYGFLGANPALLKSLAGRPDFERVRLRFNYRCGTTIIRAAEAALGEPRDYESRHNRAGTIDIHGPLQGLESEARFAFSKLVPEILGRKRTRQPGDIAVLYNDRNDGEIFASQASAAGFAYQRIDAGALYKKTRLTRWIEDACSWCSGGWRMASPRLTQLVKEWKSILHLDARDDWDQDSTSRMVMFLASSREPTLRIGEWLRGLELTGLGAALNAPSMSDEASHFRGLQHLADSGQPLSHMSIGEFGGQRGSPTHINLMTLHGSKGLEFDAVIIAGVDEGRIPSWAAKTDLQVQEARRLFYVGLTRAKDEVHLTYSGFTIDRFGRRWEGGRSRFLEEVEKRVRE